MDALIFQLYAPLASFGETAVGEFRGSHLYPARSAVLGLLAAALGLDREDEAGQSAVNAGYQVGVAVLATGSLLRDYHTSQVPSASDLKKRPHRTRADELALPKDDLNTILSTRDYRQDAASLIAITTRADAPPRWTLAELKTHLERPRFALYLGRKSCPPALPLAPKVVQAASLQAAFKTYQAVHNEHLKKKLAEAEQAVGKRRSRRDPSFNLTGFDALMTRAIGRMAWEEGVDGGVSETMNVLRKDDPLSRRRWQFADRIEHVAILTEDRAVETEESE